MRAKNQAISWGLLALFFLLANSVNTNAGNYYESENYLPNLAWACRNPGINCSGPITCNANPPGVNYLTWCTDTGDQICKAFNLSNNWKATSCRWADTGGHWWTSHPGLSNCQKNECSILGCTGWQPYTSGGCGSPLATCYVECYPPCNSSQPYLPATACGSCYVDIKCQQSIPCTDSDGGINLNVQGSGTDQWNPTPIWDNCNGAKVGELWCNGNVLYRDYYNCPSGQTCSGGKCVSACTPNSYSACYNNDRYWYNSCGTRGSMRQPCGNTSYGSWSYYCQGNARWRQRTVTNRGCSGDSCFANNSTQSEFAQDCGTDSFGSWSYYCSGNNVYRQRTVTNRGCSGSTCFANNSTQNEFRQTCTGGTTCSGGTCVSSCTNECSAGQRRCNGNNTETCGNYDGDPCLEWGNPTDCTLTGQICSGGTCITTCTDECNLTDPDRCNPVNPNTTQTCGNFDADSCLEWGDNTDCAASGQVCASGVCQSPQLNLNGSCSNTTVSLNWTREPASAGGYNVVEDGGIVQWVAQQSSSPITTNYNTSLGTHSIYIDTDDAGTASNSNTISVTCSVPCTWNAWSACGGCTPDCGSACTGTQTRTDTCGNTQTQNCTIPATSCPVGQTCQSGTCITSCTDTCPTAGATQCNGNNVETCGYYDADSCLEWGSSTDCATSGQVCQAGACVASANTIKLKVQTLNAAGVDTSQFGRDETINVVVEITNWLSRMVNENLSVSFAPAQGGAALVNKTILISAKVDQTVTQDDSREDIDLSTLSIGKGVYVLQVSMPRPAGLAGENSTETTGVFFSEAHLQSANFSVKKFITITENQTIQVPETSPLLVPLIGVLVVALIYVHSVRLK